MKKNRLKAALALATACTMSLSLCAPTFAADIGGSTLTDPNDAGVIGGEMNFEGELATPDINIVMPDIASLSGAPALMLNPYNLEVGIGTNASGVAIKSDTGVVSPTYVIKSGTDADLSIGVIAYLTAPKVTGTGDTNLNEVVIKDEADIEVKTEADGDKEVYVYLECAAEDKTYVYEVLDDSDQPTGEFKYGADFIGGYSAQPSQYLLKKAEVDDSGNATIGEDWQSTVIGILPAYTENTDADTTGTDDTAGFDTPGENCDDEYGIAAFTFGGEAQMMTKNAWTENDQVKATVIFSFNPLGKTLILRNGATEQGHTYTVSVTGGSIAVTFDKAVEGDAAKIPVKLNNAALLDKDGNDVTYLEFEVERGGDDSSPTYTWKLKEDDRWTTVTLVEKLLGNKETEYTVTVS